MTESRKSLCILAFSHVAQDARVLRQIHYLAPLYDVTVVGYGESPPCPPGIYVDWRPLGDSSRSQEASNKSRTLAKWIKLRVFRAMPSLLRSCITIELTGTILT